MYYPITTPRLVVTLYKTIPQVLCRSPWNYPINPPTFSATTPTPSRSTCPASESTRENERRKVCPVQIVPPPRLKQVAPLEPLETEPEELAPHRTSYHVHSQVQDISSSDMDTDTELGSDSDLAPSPLISPDARPVTDGVTAIGSDDDESLYQSIDEEIAPDDEVCSFYRTQLDTEFDRESVDEYRHSASTTRYIGLGLFHQRHVSHPRSYLGAG